MKTHFFSIFDHRNHQTCAKILALGGKFLLAMGQCKNHVFPRKNDPKFLKKAREARVFHKK